MDTSPLPHHDRRDFETAWELPEPDDQVVDLTDRLVESEAPSPPSEDEVEDRFVVGWAVEDPS